MPRGNTNAPDFWKIVAERFWPKVNKTEGCWLWTGSKGKRGYGQFGMPRIYGRKGPVEAHRIAYELCVGPIPEGCEIDHTCRTRTCVRPLHLEAVPHEVNLARGESPTAINARKTHCKNGHEFTPENTYYYNNGRWRRCKTCIIARARKSRENR